VPTLAIVPHLDELEQGPLGVAVCGESLDTEQLVLERREEALGHSVVVAVALGTHALTEPVVCEFRPVTATRILAAPIRVQHQSRKFDRLVPALKKLVEAGELNMKVALRAQDAAAAGGEGADEKEAVKLAKEMTSMSGVQQKKLVQERAENPDAPVDDSIEAAKTGAKITQVIVTLSSEIHRSLQLHAQSESVTQDEAAASLIEEGLAAKGF